MGIEIGMDSGRQEIIVDRDEGRNVYGQIYQKAL
jgi:hypothetical protein